MPKTKVRSKDEEKIAVPKNFTMEDKDDDKIINPDLILDDESIAVDEEAEVEDEEMDVLDDDEVDPFKDKWEE